jgi:hypothetical protein
MSLGFGQSETTATQPVNNIVNIGIATIDFVISLFPFSLNIPCSFCSIITFHFPTQLENNQNCAEKGDRGSEPPPERVEDEGCPDEEGESQKDDAPVFENETDHLKRFLRR